jgi:hypothetical protein
MRPERGKPAALFQRPAADVDAAAAARFTETRLWPA